MVKSEAMIKWIHDTILDKEYSHIQDPAIQVFKKFNFTRSDLAKLSTWGILHI